MTGGPEEGGRSRPWLRALGLLAVTFLLSVIQPLVLVAGCLALLAVTSREGGATALLVALLAGMIFLGGSARGELWYLERGWVVMAAGWFVALSLRWPDARMVTRGLGAVAGAFLAAGAFLLLRPGGWTVVDWAVRNRFTEGAAAAAEAVRLLQGEGALGTTLGATMYEMAEYQGWLFPALLGLSTLAGLGVAWWTHLRLVRGRDDGLHPLREFSFSDQLVWVVVVGCLLLLVGQDEGLRRTGANAVAFMGGLYVLRGVAVMAFMAGGVTLFGGILAALALVLLPPVILGGALLVGLGDTWLDLRARARSLAGP